MAVLAELQEEEEAVAEYDVFLSFRGKDTRLAFVDHLYHALVNQNVDTFLDEEEVETGEELKPELERAIRNSRASIIILSENYASSTWCLDELVMILEQRRSSDHNVLPIFYHVEPTNIRKQHSTFGDAMARHRQRIHAEKDQLKKRQGARKLESWTKALTQVADLKGKDANGWRETEFIENIVKEISGRLNLHLRCKIPRLMGRDFSIDTIKSWLKEGSSKNADILIIWGMAGIGKTSLAKHIYQLHHHEFETSSFVVNIEGRYAEQSSPLLDLQTQLLRDLKRRMIEVRDVDVGTAMIEKALLTSRALVVLDGIDDPKQLENLVGAKRIHPGCKIIVTTKDGSLTKKCKLFHRPFAPKHTKHALDCLRDTESLELLCWHAFGRNGPKEGYEKEARKVVKYCGGHPLALEVLGCSLRNEDVATWSNMLELLKRKIMDASIQKVLQISFHSLPLENYKEIFKHIACFFVGKDRGFTETILKECGFGTGIDMLIDRCLLTVGTANEIMMHQLLQDMGRDLVRQESPTKPWKHSRLWNHEESLNLLKEEKGSTKIQGLVLDMMMLGKKQLHGSSSVKEHKYQDDPNKYFRATSSIHGVYDFFSRIWWFFAWIFQMFSSSRYNKMEWRTEALCKMDKLHLLRLDYVKINGSYKHFPQGLIWLTMRGFQSKYIPLDLPMDNLVALDMSYSNLERAWKRPKLLGSLKILNLSYCMPLRAIEFSGLPALEQLILVGCISLVQVSESIGRCVQLVLLDMTDCKRLKKLPISIKRLTKLRILCINGCVDIVEFPIWMKDMESLEVLHAASVSKNYALSSSVVELAPRSQRSLLLSFPRTIVSLYLGKNNLFNESFPADMSSMSMLKSLHLNGNPIDSLPNWVRSLPKLEVLDLQGCDMLKSILFPPRTIEDLSAYCCYSLVNIHYYRESSAPAYVHFTSPCSLNEVQSIIKIQAISQIDKEELYSLGWINLECVKNQEVQIWDSSMWDRAKTEPEMSDRFVIFSTCFPGKEVPNWLAHTSKGSSISFTLPSSPENQTVQGLNVCFVRAFSGIGKAGYTRTKIRNITKDQTWIHQAYIFAVKEDDEEAMVWLSHCHFGNNKFEDGDEVGVTILEEEEDRGVVVRECGAGPVYFGEKEDPFGCYKIVKHTID